MLCLSRKVGEKIMIGDGPIVVTVLAIERHHIRIRVDSPKGTEVMRCEWREAKGGRDAAED